MHLLNVSQMSLCLCFIITLFIFADVFATSVASSVIWVLKGCGAADAQPGVRPGVEGSADNSSCRAVKFTAETKRADGAGEEQSLVQTEPTEENESFSSS